MSRESIRAGKSRVGIGIGIGIGECPAFGAKLAASMGDGFLLVLLDILRLFRFPFPISIPIPVYFAGMDARLFLSCRVDASCWRLTSLHAFNSNFNLTSPSKKGVKQSQFSPTTTAPRPPGSVSPFIGRGAVISYLPASKQQRSTRLG
ncbi:uncharacterized protein B0T23DRAFT_372136, partial [Neurospora hispaniola]